MANSKTSSNFRNMPYASKQSLRPPKSPFPSISPPYADYTSTPAIGPKGLPRPKDGYRSHQRTSSESFLIEEQPSWLDELLNEPETPVRKAGHRRSSSDSFAYLDAANGPNTDRTFQNDYKPKHTNSVSSWGSQVFDQYKDAQRAPYYSEPSSFRGQEPSSFRGQEPSSFRGQEPSSFRGQTNRTWDSSLNSMAYPRGVSSARDNIVLQNSGALCLSQETDGYASAASEKQDQEESGSQDLDGSSDRKDASYAKPPASETDPKRAKQQFAQRSRVRKLQYIAELERNVQALQAEGSEVSAEIEFLDQQNLILTMENKALKQRLDSLTQEQLIKYLEQEVLEREIARLRVLYQQQQQQQQQQQPLPPPSTHRRANSRDLDSQFANLSLKLKDTRTGQDQVNGQLRI